MGKYDGRKKKKGKEDILVSKGKTTRSRLSTAYMRNRRTTETTAVTMTTTIAIGTTWRRRIRKRTMTTMMTQLTLPRCNSLACTKSNL